MTVVDADFRQGNGEYTTLQSPYKLQQPRFAERGSRRVGE
jgi:hypothetical protein